MFPANKSLRGKTIDVNGKKVKIKPWMNTQLTEYESYSNNNKDKFSHDAAYDILIKDNIETNKTLTLLDEQIILLELYKISKSSSLDLIYTCVHCKTNGVNCNINLEKKITYSPLSTRSIKTDNYVFDLNSNSSYRIDLAQDTIRESIKHICSYLNEFTYKNKTYSVTDIDEIVEYLIKEVPSNDFDQLIKAFEEHQPKINTTVAVKCEHCGEEQNLNFKLIDFLG